MTPSTPPGRTVVIATPEPLGERRAGPAVRATRMAESVAAAGHEVTLVSTAPSPPATSAAGVTVTHGRAVPRDAEVYIVTGRAMLDLDWLLDSDAALGVDLYDPFQLEALHRGGTDRIRRIDLVEGAQLTLDAQLRRGDKFFCANEQQRSLWLGYLGASGRLNPAIHQHDPTARALIELAPFGVDEQPPSRGASPLREIAGIGPHDPIAVWAGGLHDWLDPAMVVWAAAAAAQYIDLRLVFVAGSPTGDPPSAAASRARAAAEEAGVMGEVVFFHPEWIPHDDRGPVLLDAAVGVCAHPDHLETRFSHRTRFLDHLWAGLPTVTTGGDPLSAQLTAAGAARTVDCGDHEAMAAALVEVAGDPTTHQTMSEAATDLGGELVWSKVMQPVVEWVSRAEPAADRLDATIAPRLGRPPSPRSSLDRLRMQWREEGAGRVAHRLWARAGRARRRS